MRLPSLAIAALGAALVAGPTIGAGTARAQLKVVTSTTDLYDIAKAVGGEKITATHIGEGYQDPHFIEAKPSFVLQLRNADVWAFVGLDLEIGWMPLLLQGARNPKLQPGQPGYVDASRVISVLDVARGNVDRSQGDVHPLGNPHYWLDPENGRRIAKLFQETFATLDPKNVSVYDANAKAFTQRLDAAERTWQADLAKIKGQPVVAWHTSWRYFAEYTGMNIVGFMEPKPGVPPSPAHLAGLIQTMKQAGAKIIIMEPFYDKKTADFVAGKTGAKVLVLAPSVGGAKGLDDYIRLMTSGIQQLAAAL
jgi:zinc/manganese transport system substrate-binding protein